MKKKIIIIGGDNRSPYIAQQLQSQNFEVLVYGMERYSKLPMDLHITTQLLDSDMYLLPIPMTKDNITLHAPYSSKPIALEEFYNICTERALVFAGKIPQPVQKRLNSKGIRYHDYALNNSFALANALPTAEGTIELIMKHTPYVIENRSICVVGYGRIGKILAQKLNALGCKVTVTARKDTQLQEILKKGYTPLHTYELEKGRIFDIVINTVPAPIITRNVLQKQKSKTLVIDLASMPGGVDFDAAKDMGIQAIHALSLPAKHAPYTAAKIITDTITQYLHETE